MRISRRKLNRLIENYLTEKKVKGAGNYEYEKRGTNIFITSNKGVPSNIKVAKGGEAYLSIANDHFPELLPKDEMPPDAEDGSPRGKETPETPEKKKESTRLQLEDIVSAIPEGTKVELADGINKEIAPTIVGNMDRLLKGENVEPSTKNAKFDGSDQVIEMCADYVNRVAKSAYGSAWIKGNVDSKINGFDKVMTPSNIKILEKAFNEINKKMDKNGKISGVPGTSGPMYKEIQKLAVQGIVPPGDAIKADVGDIVGLLYYKSGYYCQAFFESASGKYLNTGADTQSGPYFFTGDGKPWSKDADKDQNYVYDQSKGPFGFNTHVGIIGAKINGKPIVFHNIDGKVHLTPMKALYSRKHSTIGIVYIKPGPSEAAKAFDDFKTFAKGMIDTAKDTAFAYTDLMSAGEEQSG